MKNETTLSYCARIVKKNLIKSSHRSMVFKIYYLSIDGRIGFVIAFFAPVSLIREDGFQEFACYAESLIASGEYGFWAKSLSVDEYLKEFVSSGPFTISCPNKLKKIFEWF